MGIFDMESNYIEDKKKNLFIKGYKDETRN